MKTLTIRMSVDITVEIDIDFSTTSNHDIELTRELYRGARLDEILVKRTISRNGGSRNKVAELLALYPPGIEPEQGYYPGEAELVAVG